MINDNGRILTMFMVSQVGDAVRAHSRQCQSARGLPAIAGRSQQGAAKKKSRKRGGEGEEIN